MIKSFGKLEENEIIELEKKIKHRLPEDYREFLRNNNGGTTDCELICFDTENIKEGIALDVLYGINLSKSLCIEQWCEEYSTDLLEDMIIIGHAVETGIILLVNRDDWKGIYFWDNALDYENSTEDKCMYKIADTFSEFLNGLYSCEE